MSVRILPARFTVNFEEKDGSPTESIAVEWTGFGVNRTFMVAASDRMQLIKEMLGYKEIIGGNLIVHQAHEYRYISSLLTAVSASVKPLGAKMGTDPDDIRFANYADSVVDIVYKIPQWRMAEAYGGLISITETVQPTTEFVTISEQKLYWDNTQTEELDSMDAPGLLIHGLEWTYEVRGALEVLPGVWGHPGKVNSRIVASNILGVWFPVGTLLCMPPTVVRELSFDAMPTYNITLKFVAKNNGTASSPKGWNWFPYFGKTGANVTWQPIYDDAGAEKIFYPYADFRDIIVP